MQDIIDAVISVNCTTRHKTVICTV